MVGSTCWQASADASVIHLAVDVAELHHSEQYDDGHKYDRLGGRRTDVQALETGVIYLVDQNGCAGARAALRHDVDNGKGIEKGIDHIDDQQEKCGGRKQGEHDSPETACRAGAVDGGCLDQ